MKTLLFIAAILSFLSVSGQDTTYFNKNWAKAQKKDASYYRLQKVEKSGFRVNDYYMNGNLQMTGFYWQSAFRRPGDSLVKEGLFKYYDENGNLSSMSNFRNNKLFGESKTFYPDGSVHRTATYNKKGRLEGDFTVYYPDGKVRRLDHHSGGKFRDGKCYTSAGSDTAWFAFETMPEFPGGDAGRIAFLTENMVYPKAEQDMGIQGTVILSFVVQSDGSVKNVSLVRGVSRSLDIEAIRVTQAMPRWKPGMLDGKPVNVLFNMPVYFKLR